MQIWSSEIKEVEKLYDSFKGKVPLLDKEVEQLIKTDDANVAMLYSRRSLEVIVTDLCEAELKRPRKTQPLKGIIDKLNSEEKVPSNIITSMDGLNSLSAFGAHPRDFDPEQVKPVLNNLTTIIKWYLKYRNLSENAFSKNEKPEKPRSNLISQPAPQKYTKNKILISSFLALVILVLGCILVYDLIKPLKPLERSIAVLPFDNLSNNKEYSFLEDAMPEVIIMQLLQIKKFKVTPRSDIMQYKGTIKRSRTIGKELNVNYLIFGSIQIFNKEITISWTLVDARDGNQLEGKEFKNNLNNISSFQGEIAKQIAEKLQTELTPDEVRKIEKLPTKSSKAYTQFLSGNSIFNDARFYCEVGKRYNDSSSFEKAIKAYDKAILFDSTFALAYAKRAISRSWGYYTGLLDKSEIEKCKADVDKALRIDPELPEGYIALGFYSYYCKDEFKKAVESFQKASVLEPGNTEPLFYMGVVFRRLGDWEKSRHFMTAGLNNSFSNAVIITNIGITFDYLRNYDSSIIYHQKAIQAMPVWKAPYANKIKAYLLKNGRTAEARNLLDTAIAKTGKRFMKTRIELDIYDGKYTNALNILKESTASDFNDTGEKYLLYAQLAGYLKNMNNAKLYYDSSRIFYDYILRKDSDNSGAMSSLGIAYAGLNNRVKAIKLGENAVSLTEYDMIKCIDRKITLGKIYVMTGEYDKAEKLIENLLGQPAIISLKFLQLDPDWKQLMMRQKF